MINYYRLNNVGAYIYILFGFGYPSTEFTVEEQHQKLDFKVIILMLKKIDYTTFLNLE